MANQIYESQYIVNSFHAVNKNTNAVIPADESGYITAKAGDTIVFKNMNGDKNTDLNTLELFTKDAMLKIQVNDNSLYPFCVEPNSHKIGRAHV